MKGITYLNIEMSDECPLTAVYPECPRSHDRFRDLPHDRPIEVDDAVEFHRYCVKDHGFDGLLAPQFYSEPMATKPRIIELMKRLPEARFCLRINGALPGDEDADYIISRAEEVWATIYPQTDIEELRRLCIKYGQVRTELFNFDNRLAEDFEPYYNPKKPYCRRPHYELDVDYYGNGLICCGDWRGEMSWGNILVDNYADFISKWKKLREYLWKLLNPITPESWARLPRVCRLCLNRIPVMGGSLCE